MTPGNDEKQQSDPDPMPVRRETPTSDRRPLPRAPIEIADRALRAAVVLGCDGLDERTWHQCRSIREKEERE